MSVDEATLITSKMSSEVFLPPLINDSQTQTIDNNIISKQFINSPSSQYVKLNVGGILFQTTISTLTKYDSMLKAMFSGRMELSYDSSGFVSIDRCGKHFGLILNFLREGSIPLPECKMEVNEICAEARFYLIQELIDRCSSWLDYLDRNKAEPVGFRNVPVVISKKQVETLLKYYGGRPAIELLINRQNNKYSYTQHSDENFLKNQELFDKLLIRFNSRALFIKNIGIGSSEICQWTFYGNFNSRKSICCTSIVYCTDKKQTKVEFPEARIYEEALNTLLTYDQNSPICANCSTLFSQQQNTLSLCHRSMMDCEDPDQMAQFFNGILSPKDACCVDGCEYACNSHTIQPQRYGEVLAAQRRLEQ